MELGVAAVDFEAEEVLPFAAAHGEPGGLAGGVAEAEKRVVIHGHFPEIGGDVACHGGEVAEENAGEVNEVDALVNEFAAAGELGVGAPFFFVAEAAALAVASAHKHHGAERAAAEDFQRLEGGGMVAVVVADAHEGAGLLGGGGEFSEFGHADGGGFFDEDVLAVFHGGEGDGGEGGIDGGDHHDVHVGRADGLRKGVGGEAAGALGGELFGAVELGVARDGDAAGGQEVETFLADEAATDEGDARKWGGGHVRLGWLKKTIRSREYFV